MSVAAAATATAAATNKTVSFVYRLRTEEVGSLA